MNPNYRTLNNDIGMVQRTNNGWDLWFDNGDLVKAEDFHSLQVGIIIACLTSWNYMNRYGNPTYEVFGNRAYQLLKANKSGMVQYKIQQFFLECLKRMRRVYDVVSLTVSEVPYDPYKYHVEFEVISINNQLVDGSFIVTTDASKSASYIDYNVYMPYASNESDLEIDLWLKNEYGGGLEGEILYMYLQKGDGEYEFYDVVGRTDETGYLRVTYSPTESNENNVVYFDFHGNSTYNPSTSKRTVFETELFEYFIEFINDDIVDYRDYADLSVRLRKKSLLDDECYPVDYATITVLGTDGRIYETLTDSNGEATVRVKITENTLFTTYYANKSDETSYTIIKKTRTITLEQNKDELLVGEQFILTAKVTDEFENALNDIEVIFECNGEVLDIITTNVGGVATLTLPSLDVGEHTITAKVLENDFYHECSDNVDVAIIGQEYTIELNQSSYNTTGSLSVSATLLDDGVAVEGATVSFTGGVSTVTAVTNGSGVATATVNFTSSGTLTASYSNVSDTASVTVSHNYSLAFSSSSYVATGGSAEVSVTLLDDNVVVSGATVTFSGGSSTVTATTDSNGVATATVTFSQSGTLTVSYGNVSDTCTVTTQTIIFDDSTEYTATVTPSGDTRANIIPTFNFDASVDFEMTCDVYFAKDGSSFGLFPSNNTTQFAYHLTYGQNGDSESVYYGNSNGGESSVRNYGTQSFNEWFSLKFVKVGHQVTTYKNGTLFSSNIPTTTLGDHGNMMFAFGFWGSGSHTSKVKNLKIVQI